MQIRRFMRAALYQSFYVVLRKKALWGRRFVAYNVLQTQRATTKKVAWFICLFMDSLRIIHAGRSLFYFYFQIYELFSLVVAPCLRQLGVTLDCDVILSITVTAAMLEVYHCGIRILSGLFRRLHSSRKTGVHNSWGPLRISLKLR